MMYQCYFGDRLFDLSEEILHQLHICGDSLDSFTLEKNLSALETVRDRSGLNEQEYFVTAAILTRLGHERRALELLEEGREKYVESLLLHGAAVQAHISLWQKKEGQFHFDRGWFEHPANLETEPYRATWQASRLPIGAATIELNREIRGVIIVRRDDDCTVEFGPFKLEYAYDHVVNHRLRTDVLIGETLAEAVFLERLSEIEHRYLVDAFGSPPSQAFGQVISKVELKGVSEELFTVEILELPGRTFATLRTAKLVGSGANRKHALEHLKSKLSAIRHKWVSFAEVPNTAIAQYWAARNLIGPDSEWMHYGGSMRTDKVVRLSLVMALIVLGLYTAGSCSNPTASTSPEEQTGASNANLAKVKLSAGSLKPAFDPEITRYTLVIPEGVETVILTGVSEDPNATVGGDSGMEIGIDPRATNILITVEAENEVDKTEYRIGHLTELETVPVSPGRFQWDDSGDNVAIITKPYRIGKYPVTQSQFEAVMGFNPSLHLREEDSPDRPVERVNWYHAIAFANRLSLIEGFNPVYSVTGVDFADLKYDDIPTDENDRWDDVTADWGANGYRLPTQMEWMWAAMGGNKDATAEFTENGANKTGWQKPFAGYDGSNSLGDNAWYRANSDNQTRPVGLKSPNELGIFDMSGNVWEWDWGIRYILHDKEIPYPPGTTEDYRGPDRNPDWDPSWRVLRGGSYVWDSGGLHFSIRFRRLTCSQQRQWSRHGFRVARSNSTQ